MMPSNRRTALLAALGGLLAAAWALPAVAADSAETLIAKEACKDLVLGYAHYWDHPDADGFASIFAEDAALKVGPPVTGREAIKARVAGNKGERLYRHVMTNIRIEMIDAKSARGISYAQVFTAPAPEEGKPATYDGIPTIGEYHDTFRLTAEGWKIAEREFKVILRRAPAAPAASPAPSAAGKP